MLVYVVVHNVDRESSNVAVFDSEEKAKKYCDDRNTNQLCLEEYSYEEFDVE